MQAEITQALAALNFTAIDFETANEGRASACAVGVVRMRGGVIVESFETLLRPRELRVNWRNQAVHGIPVERLTMPPPWPMCGRNSCPTCTGRPSWPTIRLST